ncbi:phage tail tape measure protein [Escherichia coli]|nr:phage tail tape measure protein [Escherichia coli]
MKGLENAIRNLNSLDTRMVPQASAWAINRVAQKAVSVATRQVAGNTVAGDNQVKGIPLKLNFKSFTSSVLSDMAKILAQATMMKSIKGIGSVLGFDLSSLSLNANGGIYQSADLSRYSGTVVNRPTFFAFAKGAGVMGEAGPEAILPLRRGADGKLGVVADIGGSGMAMFAPQYNIEINNDGTNGQIGPAALKVVYDLGKKAAADFMQQQARDGGRLSGAYR